MISPEQQTEARLTLLEKQLLDLSARINKLEYANMKYGGPVFTPGALPHWPIPGLPVTCDGSPTIGMEIKQ